MENIEMKEIKLEIPKLEMKNENSSQDGKESTSHKYLKCASCCKNLEGSGSMLAWDMHVFCDDICLSKFYTLILFHNRPENLKKSRPKNSRIF